MKNRHCLDSAHYHRTVSFSFLPTAALQRNFVSKRKDVSTQSCTDAVRVVQRTQRTPSEYLPALRSSRSARQPSFACEIRTKFAQNLQHIPAFSREILLDFERLNRKISAPNATLTQPKAAPTSCVLHSARGRCRPTSVSVAHRNRIKFASESRVFSHKFPRFRTRKSKNVGAKRSAHSAESYADIMRVAQRT